MSSQKIGIKSYIEQKLENVSENRMFLEYSKLVVKEVKKHIKKIYRPNCTACKKNFKDEYIYRNHLIKIHKLNPFECNTCNQSYPFMKDLKNHIKLEHLQIDKEFESKYLNIEHNLH